MTTAVVPDAPSNDNALVLRMLFEEHHRQLTDKRQKIHSTTEKTLAILFLIAGWLVFARDPLTSGVRWVIVPVIIVLSLVSSSHVYVNNRSYHSIARLVSRINVALGLFEEGRFIPDKILYPPKWKNFGETGEFKGAASHILAIVAAAVLCVFAAFMRA